MERETAPGARVSPVKLDPLIRDMAREANFAVLTTLMPDGSAQSHVMWVDASDEHLLINTEVHRKKFKNIERDPRVTVVILPKDNPYSFAEVRGVVVERLTGPDARAHIDALSRKYGGNDYPESAITTERVILKIEPVHQYRR